MRERESEGWLRGLAVVGGAWLSASVAGMFQGSPQPLQPHLPTRQMGTVNPSSLHVHLPELSRGCCER